MSVTAQAPLLLEGLKIVSLCHYLQGPAAAQYLADMGAEVVKVEPLDGAYERHSKLADTSIDGVSGLMLSTNRNNRSLALDLKSAKGHEVFMRLVEGADVVVENFRPGVLTRLGLGLEALRKRNPGIILACASGYGSSGPSAHEPGQDLLVQARSGLIAVTGPASRRTALGCSAIDQHGASLLAMGILGAYVKRLRTGVGTLVEANLFNAGIDLQMEALTIYMSGGFKRDVLKRHEGLATWFHQAPYGVYAASDGDLVISMINPSKLAEALEDDTLRSLAALNRYAHRDAFAQAVAQAVARRTCAENLARLGAAGLWCGPVNDYDDLAKDPQAIHNEVFRQVEVGAETATLVNHPLRYDGGCTSLRNFATRLGEHTEEILSESGFTEAEVADLIGSGVVKISPAPVVVPIAAASTVAGGKSLESS